MDKPVLSCQNKTGMNRLLLFLQASRAAVCKYPLHILYKTKNIAASSLPAAFVPPVTGQVLESPPELQQIFIGNF